MNFKYISGLRTRDRRYQSASWGYERTVIRQCWYSYASDSGATNLNTGRRIYSTIHNNHWSRSAYWSLSLMGMIKL